MMYYFVPRISIFAIALSSVGCQGTLERLPTNFESRPTKRPSPQQDKLDIQDHVKSPRIVKKPSSNQPLISSSSGGGGATAKPNPTASPYVCSPADSQFGITTQVQLPIFNPESNATAGKKLALDPNESNEVLIVGSPGESEQKGAAHVYQRNSANNNFELQRVLKASDAQSADFFGSAVAISGTVAIVGAPLRNGPYAKCGAAYIYKASNLDAFDYTETTILTAYDAGPEDRFGSSVSIHGDYIAIGSRRANEGKGAVYIYRKEDSAFVLDEKLFLVAGEIDDNFGASVALLNDVLIVSAPGTLTGSKAGRVFTYHYDSSSQSWLLDFEITPSSGGTGALYGQAISLDINSLVVGRPGESTHGVFSGGAYIYKKSASMWLEENILYASDSDSGNFFGSSVSIKGSQVAVGAPLRNSTKGGVYLFSNSPQEGWVEIGIETARDVPEQSMRFGSSVATNGVRILSGASHYERHGTSNSGAIYDIALCGH